MNESATTIERGPLGYCPSCYQDVPKSLPLRPIAEPLCLGDEDLVALWQLWCQEWSFSSWIDPDADSLDGFMAWLCSAPDELQPTLRNERLEQEFLEAFRQHFSR